MCFDVSRCSRDLIEAVRAPRSARAASTARHLYRVDRSPASTCSRRSTSIRSTGPPAQCEGQPAHDPRRTRAWRARWCRRTRWRDQLAAAQLSPTPPMYFARARPHVYPPTPTRPQGWAAEANVGTVGNALKAVDYRREGEMVAPVRDGPQALSAARSASSAPRAASCSAATAAAIRRYDAATGSRWARRLGAHQQRPQTTCSMPQYVVVGAGTPVLRAPAIGERHL